jgi:hypothetical protein
MKRSIAVVLGLAAAACGASPTTGIPELGNTSSPFPGNLAPVPDAGDVQLQDSGACVMCAPVPEAGNLVTDSGVAPPGAGADTGAVDPPEAAVPDAGTPVPEASASVDADPPEAGNDADPPAEAGPDASDAGWSTVTCTGNWYQVFVGAGNGTWKWSYQATLYNGHVTATATVYDSMYGDHTITLVDPALTATCTGSDPLGCIGLKYGAGTGTFGWTMWFDAGTQLAYVNSWNYQYTEPQNPQQDIIESCTFN